MRLVLLASVLSLLASSAVAAYEDSQRTTTLGVNYGQDRLSDNLSNWWERALQIQHQLEKHHVIGADVTETERFGLRDTRIGIRYTRPLDKRFSATIDAEFSSTHRAVARNALGASLQIEFAPAWLLHVGGRTTEYDPVTVNQALIGLEHYFTSFSWAMTLRPARAFGETVLSGSVRGSYYYGVRNSVNLFVATGEEAASIGSIVTLSQVRALAVTGRHWLDSQWAVTYAASLTRQGNAYSRSGIRLGIRYVF